MWVHPRFTSLLAKKNKEVEDTKTYKMKDEVDCFFISFPKSGRTWVLAFLQLYFMVAFEGGIRIFDHSFFCPKETGKPKISFAHRLLEYRTGAKTIFMLRDPRDVMVSYYFQSSLRTGSVLPDASLSQFVRNDKMGMPQYVRYHHVFYELLKQSEETLILRYEDLKTDELAQWHRLLRFLEIEPNYKLLKGVAHECSFDVMKKNVKDPEGYLATHPTNWQFMAMENGEVTTDPKNPEAHKLRKGKVGGYKDYLPERDIAYIEAEMEQMPEEWRYE
jgi:hypothetical protein